MAGINRYKLMEQLELVEPALADTNIVAVLKNFMFTGTRLLAYNDRIAISVPLKNEFKGGVPGSDLLKMIRSFAHSDTVHIVPDNGRVKLIAGTAKAHLGLLNPEAFPFKMPAWPEQSEGVLNNDSSDAFFAAIDDLLQSVNTTNATREDELGITLLPENNQFVRMYSCNGRTLSYSRQKLPQLKLQRRVLLPAEFCKQMLKLQKDAERQQLVIRQDHALFVANKAALFGRLLTSTNPIDFNSLLKRVLPADFPRGMAKMDREGKQHERLKQSLDSAMAIGEKDVHTAIEVNNNIIKLHSMSQYGQTKHEIKDEVKIDYHPPISMRINASLLANGYDKYDDILMTKKCVIMKRGENLFLVGTYG